MERAVVIAVGGNALILEGQRGTIAEQAKAELTRAIDLYRDMEMTLWLPEAESELAKVG